MHLSDEDAISSRMRVSHSISMEPLLTLLYPIKVLSSSLLSSLRRLFLSSFMGCSAVVQNLHVFNCLPCLDLKSGLIGNRLPSYLPCTHCPSTSTPAPHPLHGPVLKTTRCVCFHVIGNVKLCSCICATIDSFNIVTSCSRGCLSSPISGIGFLHRASMADSVAPGCVSLHTLRLVSDDGGTGQN